jgi:hypothetical protein
MMDEGSEIGSIGFDGHEFGFEVAEGHHVELRWERKGERNKRNRETKTER